MLLYAIRTDMFLFSITYRQKNKKESYIKLSFLFDVLKILDNKLNKKQNSKNVH